MTLRVSSRTLRCTPLGLAGTLAPSTQSARRASHCNPHYEKEPQMNTDIRPRLARFPRGKASHPICIHLWFIFLLFPKLESLSCETNASLIALCVVGTSVPASPSVAQRSVPEPMRSIIVFISHETAKPRRRKKNDACALVLERFAALR
jgi:hypothetical protein